MATITEKLDIEAVQSGNVLIDFYTSTCAPCKALNPILEEIAKEFDNLTVAKIEVTKNPDVAQKFGVMSVPTVVFMMGSKVKEVSSGFSGRDAIKAMIRRHLCR